MQDRPTASELLQAVGEFLEHDVLSAVEGRVAFLTKVAMNVVATVRRELELGVQHDTAQRERLVALFNRDGTTAELERELAAAIRSGALTDRQHAAAVAHVTATVREKLEVANPKYLSQ